MAKMTKVSRYSLFVLLSLSIFNIMSCTVVGNDRSGDMTKKYKVTLYALGAVQVSELDRKFWSDEKGQAVRLKGERIDVNGWLSPYWAKSDSFLTDAEKQRYGIPKKPLTYAKYISLLDVDGYRKAKHPLQYAIMAFVLENMLTQGVEVEEPGDIVRVYEARVGLETRALKLLKNRTTSVEAMRLYNKHGDTRLLDVFPVPKPQEEDYIRFLGALAEREPDQRFHALSLLYAMDKVTYKTNFRDYMVLRIRKSDSWLERGRMYRALVEIGDQKSVESLADSLLKDPVTECREAIIRAALARNLWSKELVGSGIQLAQGLGGQHRTVTPSRMEGQWRHILREYLLWARDHNLCDAATRTAIEGALELLQE
jgi:hypothetical protein